MLKLLKNTNRRILRCKNTARLYEDLDIMKEVERILEKPLPNEAIKAMKADRQNVLDQVTNSIKSNNNA